jgi:hypothetical protein
VERSSEADSECLHTLADLTDILEEDRKHRQYEGDVAALAVQQSQEATEHCIHTPINSPKCLSDETADGDIATRTETLAASICHSVGISSAVDDLVIDHDDQEKVEIILFAFDEDGDGLLTFQDLSTLHRMVSGVQLSYDAFRQMCADEGVDDDVGVGRDVLSRVCARNGDLNKHFDVAKAKLKGTVEQECTRNAQEIEQANPITLMLKNPLLAVPFALDATERVRRRVALQLMPCRA